MSQNPSLLDDHKQANDEINEFKSDIKYDIDSRLLWILIPLLVGGCVSMFSNFAQDVQIIVWGVMFLIAVFGLWTHNAKKLRIKREELENRRWSNLDKRFDTIDAELASLQQTDRTLLRNELVTAHREWVEEKGYITLEALEFIDETYEEYHSKGGNGSGTRLWEDIHNLPIRENRA